MASESFISALRRYGGMWGSAWRDSKMLSDVVAVTATTSRARIDVPLVGKNRTGAKPGRISTDATMSFQKIDTGWEWEVYKSLQMDVDALRAARDAGTYGTLDGTFNLILTNDDPHAYGKESWQLTGCQLWQFEVGMNINDDFIGRDMPLTFDEAVPLEAFTIVGGVVTKVATVKP